MRQKQQQNRREIKNKEYHRQNYTLSEILATSLREYELRHSTTSGIFLLTRRAS